MVSRTVAPRHRLSTSGVETACTSPVILCTGRVLGRCWEVVMVLLLLRRVLAGVLERGTELGVPRSMMGIKSMRPETASPSTELLSSAKHGPTVHFAVAPATNHSAPTPILHGPSSELVPEPLHRLVVHPSTLSRIRMDVQKLSLTQPNTKPPTVYLLTLMEPSLLCINARLSLIQDTATAMNQAIGVSLVGLLPDFVRVLLHPPDHLLLIH
mmetsp:Transcript_30004/g.38688  ORF Transcript_30004/g.38688 Transcript_30004/m.38688 type:complete len:212 (+) Transcript_30004:136-771(+)